MDGWVRALAAGLLLVALNGAAGAQENLEQGKNAAQLFATDCAICHKSAQALVKEGYPTEGFLRVHYTSSREMAAALFTYLRSVARADAAAAGQRRGKARAKPAGKEGEAKPAAARKPAKRAQKESEKAPGAKAGEVKTPEKKDQPESKKE